MNSKGLNAMPVSHSSNCVSLKMQKDEIDTNKGARITIGKNGGMQYLGRMNQVSESYQALCHIMSRQMNGREFMQHLSRSHEMMAHTFPEGVRRTRGNVLVCMLTYKPCRVNRRHLVCSYQDYRDFIGQIQCYSIGPHLSRSISSVMYMAAAEPRHLIINGMWI